MNPSSEYQISTNARRFDLALIHDFLRSSYWAQGIPRDVVERAVENSLCFGAFIQERQVGFARVITDRATFAYLADVFVVPEHRGRGVAKLLLRTILAHPDLQGLRRMLLATKDAHELYAPFGFAPLSNPKEYMTIHRPGIFAIAERRITG
jgi:GNAT superfamily N-acetyltransferase